MYPDPVPDPTHFFIAFKDAKKTYFSPLNTFMRKGKDPEPDPDPHL
jgi:hypothetical protein